MFKVTKNSNKKDKIIKNNRPTSAYQKKNVSINKTTYQQKVSGVYKGKFKLNKYKKKYRSYAERLEIRERVKKKMEKQSIFTALCKRCYVLNILFTRTNIFITVTTYNGGKVIISKSAKMAGYSGPKKRMKEVSFVLLDLVLNKLKKIIPWNKRKNKKRDELRRPIFIVAFRGSKSWKYMKIIKYLVRKIRLNIWRVIAKPDYPFNGCRLKIKKRKKRKHRKKPPVMQKRVKTPWVAPQPKSLRVLFMLAAKKKKDFAYDCGMYFWQNWEKAKERVIRDLPREKLKLREIMRGPRQLRIKNNYYLLKNRKNISFKTYVFLFENLLHKEEVSYLATSLLANKKKRALRAINKKLKFYEKTRKENFNLYWKVWSLKNKANFKKSGYRRQLRIYFYIKQLRKYLITLTLLKNFVKNQKRNLLSSKKVIIKKKIKKWNSRQLSLYQQYLILIKKHIKKYNIKY